MSFNIELFKQLLEELRVFSRNLVKDSHERRTDIQKVTKKREKLDKLTESFETLKTNFNKETHNPETISKVKIYVGNIVKLIDEIDKIL